MRTMQKILLLVLLCVTALAILCSCNLCLHFNIEESITPPTCTTAGKTTHTCPDCGYTYVDSIIEPQGHVYEAVVTEPTCEDEGFTTYTCECGHSYVSDHTAALGHDYSKEFYTISPTCEEQGYTFYSCSRCEHSYVTDYVKPQGHSYKKTVTNPTCTDSGYTTYSCNNCKHSFVSDYVKPKGHDISTNVTSPTCTDQGYTTYFCSACDYSYISEYTDPTGHNYSRTVTPPTCTEQGFTTYECDNCDDSYISDYTEPRGHKYTEQVLTKASCTDTGITKFECICGDSYEIIVSATGHDFSRLVTMPTLSDMGYTEFDCKNCDFFYTGDYRFYSDILPGGAYAGNSEVLALGIDVSQYNYNENGAIDFAAIKEAGVDYVIIKAGSSYRDAFTVGGIEPAFLQSYNDAKTVGLDVGVYFYTYAKSVDEILLDAELLLRILDGKQFEYPIYLDLEDESLADLSPATLTEMCVEFFTVLQRAGYYTGLYVNDEWLYNKIQTDVALSKFEIWYARYPEIETDEYVWDINTYGANLGMWQYTDKGSFEAIPDIKFDFNFAYKDYPSIIKEGGYNGYESDVKFIDSGKQFVYIVANSINVRSSADFDADNVMGIAYKGQRFEVLEISDEFIKIKYKGLEAYITANAEYVTTELPLP